MRTTPDIDSLAVLIDADNTSWQYAKVIFDEIAKFGNANVRRIYGDFSGPRLSGWNNAIESLAILQHQQRTNSTGKNASDIALVIDAMDLMYKGRLDGFCLVSSDSDFTRLAQRLREDGLIVYGFGEQKTPESFRNACTRFTYLENLHSQEISEERPSKSSGKQTKFHPKDAVPIIIKVMGHPDDDEWVNLATIGARIQGTHPDFDPRTYGCSNLSKLVEESGRFESKRTGQTVLVRAKA